MPVEPRVAVLVVAAAMGLGPHCLGCGGTGSGSTPAAGAADSPTGNSNNGCGNTQADPHHCGTCDRDCAGGACQAGTCVPLAPGILASGQHTPGGIVADAANVYWVDRGTRSSATGAFTGAQVMKCAKAGCKNTPTVLATGPWTDVTNLAIDAANVYWGASGKLFACSVNGCNDAPAVLWSGASGPGTIAISDASVYLSIPDSEQVILCSTDGCDGGETLSFEGDGSGVSSQFANPVLTIAADKDGLYALVGGSLGGVIACTPSRCAESARLLALGPVPQSLGPLIAVDNTNVYFASFTSLLSGFTPPRPAPPGLEIDGNGGLAELKYVAKQSAAGLNGPSGTLLEGLSSPSAIAVDGTTVYVAGEGEPNDASERASGTGQIVKCAVAGCNGLSVTVQGYVNYPQGIAVDGANVYWTDFGSGTDPSGSDDGRVMFRAK